MSRLISFSRLAVAATRCRRSLPNVVSQRFMATTLSHTPLNFQVRFFVEGDGKERRKFNFKQALTQ